MSTQKGRVGEDIACTILLKQGYLIIDRNYYTRYGEIDIIAQKNGFIRMVEVKSSFGEYNPAENFHARKFKRLLTTVRIYCYKNKISIDDISIDLLILNTQTRTAKLIQNANLYFY